MSIRIGVDVGGTFTKAVACDSSTGEVLARSVVPTTHASRGGVADGLIEAIGAVGEDVSLRDGERVDLVAHSTTQAVNALLEGDTSVVGVLGMGRRPDLKRARKRTEVGAIRLAPGRSLGTRHAFVDVSLGFDQRAVRHCIHELAEAGAEVIVVSEAFGVDDARAEWAALEIAEDMGIPACAGHELSGLYGLEMRTVTAALNASILPTAIKTARLVQEAAQVNFADVPLLVMRGDGGAVDLDVMRRHPLLTAFSGPAASVSGALRRLPIRDAIVLEVGGTSTNIATIKGGRPVLSYVRVLEHVTCVRSLDVRVLGVAGGSLIRLRRRMKTLRLADVGPRSAHIAGLPYASFIPAEDLEGATARLVSPRVGDPAEYLVLETSRGRLVAVTLTCAANALQEVASGSYASGNRASAVKAFEIAGHFAGVPGQALARAVLDAAAAKVAGAVTEAASEHGLDVGVIVGLGGGAGALVPASARTIGAAWEIPKDAEVISSIGDAQSMVRVELERTMARPTAEDIAAVHRDAEASAIRAGAAPGTIHLESASVPERGALRVTAYGSVALTSGPARVSAAEEDLWAAAHSSLPDVPELVFKNEFFAVFCSGVGDDRPFAIVDRTGATVLEGVGKLVAGSGEEVAAVLDTRISSLARHYGPVAVAPAVRLVRGARLVDLTLIAKPDEVREAAAAECALAHGENVAAFLTRD